MEENEINKYGGVCIIVGARLAPYIQEVKINPLGKFLSVTLMSQQGTEVTIIAACNSNPGYASSGDKMVWQQQQNYHLLHTNSVNSYDPRKETIKSLCKHMQEKKKSGSVILALDANKNQEIKQHSYCIFH